MVSAFMVACRTGKCRRRAEGCCKYVHDTSKVAVCPSWLAGLCKDAACPLQHAHAPALMPVCSFFLNVRIVFYMPCPC